MNTITLNTTDEINENELETEISSFIDTLTCHAEREEAATCPKHAATMAEIHAMLASGELHNINTSGFIKHFGEVENVVKEARNQYYENNTPAYKPTKADLAESYKELMSELGFEPAQWDEAAAV